MAGHSSVETHVFVVRTWREPRDVADAPALWRGVVEHVASGERRYWTDVGEVPAFIASRVDGLTWGRHWSERVADVLAWAWPRRRRDPGGPLG